MRLWPNSEKYSNSRKFSKSKSKTDYQTKNIIQDKSHREIPLIHEYIDSKNILVCSLIKPFIFYKYGNYIMLSVPKTLDIIAQYYFTIY